MIIPRWDPVIHMPEITYETVRLIQTYTESMGTTVILPQMWHGTATSYANITTAQEHTYRIKDALGIEAFPAGNAWA